MSLQELRVRDTARALLEGKIRIPERVLVCEIYTKLQGWTPPDSDEEDEITPEDVERLIHRMELKKYIYKRGDWIYPGKFPEKRKKTHTGRDLLSIRTLKNIGELESVGFSFGNEVQKVPVKQKRGKTAHSFYVKGRDPRGLSVEYCRHETWHPGAGRTFLRTPFGGLSVWKLLNNESKGSAQSRKAVKHYIGIPVWNNSDSYSPVESAIMRKLGSRVGSILKPNDISTRDLYIELANQGKSIPGPGDLSIEGLDRSLRHLKSRGYIEGGPKKGYKLPEPV